MSIQLSVLSPDAPKNLRFSSRRRKPGFDPPSPIRYHSSRRQTGSEAAALDMQTIIFIAAVFVIASIVVSISTAHGIQSQKEELAKVQHRLADIQDELSEVTLRKDTVAGNVSLLEKVRDEKEEAIRLLDEELEELMAERVEEKEIKSAPGLERREGLE